MGKRTVDFIIPLLRVLGIEIIISPLLIYWFIHRDYETYMWIIKGPYPFSSFGSGPFMIRMFIMLFLTGVLLICISYCINKAKKS